MLAHTANVLCHITGDAARWHTQLMHFTCCRRCSVFAHTDNALYHVAENATYWHTQLMHFVVLHEMQHIGTLT